MDLQNPIVAWLGRCTRARYVSLIAAALLVQIGWSQCTTGGLAGILAPTGTYQTIGVVAGGPDYFEFGATIGTSYDFSLCTADGGTSAGDDSYLTLTNNVGTSLLTADDICDGAAAKLSWVATGTATFRIYVSNFICDPRPAGYVLAYRGVAGGGGGGNDACANAIPLTCGSTTNGTTVGSTGDVYPTCGSATAGHPGIWYSIVGDGGQYTASLCGSAFDTQVSIFSGGCGALACVAGNDDACGLQSTINWNTVNGTTYLIFIHGFSSQTGTFTLNVTCQAPCTPVVTNEVCATATPITINSVGCSTLVNGNTNCADANLPTPAGACFFSGFSTFPDQWYTFTTGPAASQLAMTITFGTATGLGYGLYTGACGGLTQVGCSTGVTSGAAQALTVLPSTTYYLQILGLQANRGSYTLCLTQPVPTCTSYTSPADAATVGGNPVPLAWNAATFATGYDVYVDQTNPPATLVSSNQAGTTYNYVPTNPTAGEVYYWSIVPRNSGGTATDAPCAVRSFTLGAPPCPVLTTPANGSIIQASTGTTLGWNASAGATLYTIYMDNSLTPTTLVGGPQAGTTFATGALSPNLTYYWTVTATGPYGTSTGCSAISFNTNPPACLALPTAPTNGGTACSGAGTTLSWPASPGATGYDVYFQVGAPPATNQVATNQAGTTFNAGVLGGGSYSWRVVPRNSNGPATGCPDWTFSVISSPPGDIAATAFPITSLPFVSAGNDNLAANCWTESNGVGGRDIYWSIMTSPCTTTLTIGICGTGDSRLVVMAADGTTVLLNIDDALPPGCSNGLNSYVLNWPVTPNTLYYIVMDAFTGTSDLTATTLTVEANCFCTAPVAEVSSINDNCGANTFTLDVLTSTTGSTATANIVYTVNGGAPITVAGVNPGSTTTIPAVGSFPTSATIVVSVTTSDGQCSTSLGDFSSGCPINIVCGNITTINYCYKNNDPKSWIFHTNTPGATLTLDFTGGTMATGDVINAYSGTNAGGTPIGTLTGNFPTLFGASGTSTGQDIFLQVVSDASNSCFDGGQTEPWQFEVKCTNLTCTNAEGSAVVEPNCSMINIEVLDPGNLGSTTLQWVVNGGTPQLWPNTLFGGESFAIGPFTPGQSVVVTLLHPTESGCNETLGTFVIPAQPTPVTPIATATPATICPNGSSQLLAQLSIPGTANQYQFSTGTGATLHPMTGAATLHGPGVDDGASAVQSMGFTFRFENTNYTQFSANSNGLTRLGPTAVTTALGNNITAASNQPKIMGWWDDLHTGTDGSVRTVLDNSGGPGNNIRIIEFFVRPFGVGTAASMRFQVWFFENGNVVEYRYGPASATSASSSIGIGGLNAAQYMSVTSTTHTATNAAVNNANATWPGSGRYYRFSPPTMSATYSWSPATFLDNTAIANPLASSVTATTPYTVTMQGINGCTYTANATVTVGTPINDGAVTPPTASVCTGSTTVFTATPANGIPPFTYAWTDPNSVAAGTAQTVTAGINGVWSVLITDACGASITRTATLTVNPVPTATAGNNGPLCVGQVLNLTGGTNIGTQFAWTGPGGYTSTEQNPTRGASTFAMAGTYSLVASTAFCNSVAANTTVVINALPPPVVVTPAAPVVCSGTPVDLTASLGPVLNPFNGGAVTIPAGAPGTTSGNASPYPSNLSVAGLPTSGVILKQVRINGFAHTFPADVAILLQSPSGTNVVIMADAGGGTDATGQNWIFQDGAPTMTNAALNPSGTYRCFDGGAGADTYPAPGPGAIDQTNPLLSNFTGDMNGTWKLFVVDQVGGDVGSFPSWNLVFEYIPVTYAWSPATGLSGTTGATVTSTVTANQPYVVTASSVAAPTCQSTGNVTVTMDLTDSDNDGVIDCLDNCDFAPGQIGSFCDDGNPNTVLTQLDANCNCVGGQACTTTLTLEMRTDNNPAQITWELRDETNGVLVQSGPSMFGPGQPYPAPNATFTENTCLPDGCYRLRVRDSGGDGITGGGYILRTAGSPGNRIIDNRGNFGNLPGGPPDVSAIANNQGFCLPMGTGKLIYTSCDKLDWVTGEYIVASPDPGVAAQWSAAVSGPNEANSGYEFWFYNPNGGYTFRKFRDHTTSDGFAPDNASRACHLKINNWAAASQIPANVLMNVKVRTRIAGVNASWGPACRFKIDPVRAACPLTKLMDIPGNPQFSCNVLRPWGNGNYVYARPVSGATQYQWRFRIDAENFVAIRTTTTYYVQLNWVTLPLQNGKTYNVEVRAFKNGAWCIDTPTPTPGPNWVTWGDVCLLTIDNTPVNGGENFAPEAVNGLSMYPNPNRGDQLYLSLDAVEEGVRTVSVDIVDVFGKRVSARTIPVTDGYVNTVLDFDADMANGLYMVNITAGEQRYTERLVIQK